VSEPSIGMTVRRNPPVDERYTTDATCPLYRGEPDVIAEVDRGGWFRGESCRPTAAACVHWWRIGVYHPTPTTSTTGRP
jgi:hypothetical protein